MNEQCYHLGAKAIIWNSENKILLLKVNVKKLLRYSGVAYWDLPGGRVKTGEEIESALRREVKEETGIENIQKIEPFSIDITNLRIPVDKRSVGLILKTFICYIAYISEIALDEENTEAEWFSPARAAELLQVKFPPSLTEKIKNL